MATTQIKHAVGAVKLMGHSCPIELTGGGLEVQTHFEGLVINSKRYISIWVRWRWDADKWHLNLTFDPHSTEAAYTKLYAEALTVIPEIATLRSENLMPYLMNQHAANMQEIKALAERTNAFMQIAQAVERLLWALEESPLEIAERLFPGKLCAGDYGSVRLSGTQDLLYPDALDCLEVIADWCERERLTFPAEYTAARHFATQQRNLVRDKLKSDDSWSVARLQYRVGRMNWIR